MRVIFSVLGIALGLVALQPKSGRAQSSCLTNTDTAAAYLASARLALQGDSASLVAKGLPYKPAANSVTLVTTSTTCSKVVSAYNASYPTNNPGRITKAYVVKVGNSIYAAVPSKSTMSPRSHVLYFYDTKYNIKAVMSTID